MLPLPSSSPSESRRTSTEHRRTSTDLRRTSLDNNRRASGASELSLRQDYALPEDRAAAEYALYSPREEAEDSLAGAGVGTSGLEGRSGSGSGSAGAAAKQSEADSGVGDVRKDSNSILEDMERFQREIDELRSRYKQAG